MSFTLMASEIVPYTILPIRYIFLLVHCSTYFDKSHPRFVFLMSKAHFIIFAPYTDWQTSFYGSILLAWIKFTSRGVNAHQLKLFWLINFNLIKHVYPDGSGVFQEDNAAYVGQECSQNSLMSVKMMFSRMFWPQQSSDLNPSEHQWEILD